MSVVNNNDSTSIPIRETSGQSQAVSSLNAQTSVTDIAALKIKASAFAGFNPNAVEFVPNPGFDKTRFVHKETSPFKTVSSLNPNAVEFIPSSSVGQTRLVHQETTPFKPVLSTNPVQFTNQSGLRQHATGAFMPPTSHHQIGAVYHSPPLLLTSVGSSFTPPMGMVFNPFMVGGYQSPTLTSHGYKTVCQSPMYVELPRTPPSVTTVSTSPGSAHFFPSPLLPTPVRSFSFTPSPIPEDLLKLTEQKPLPVEALIVYMQSVGPCSTQKLASYRAISQCLTDNQGQIVRLDIKTFMRLMCAFSQMGYRDTKLFEEIFIPQIMSYNMAILLTVLMPHDIIMILKAFISLNIMNDRVFSDLSNVINKQRMENVPYSISQITTILWQYAVYKAVTSDNQFESFVKTIMADSRLSVDACLQDKDLIRFVQAAHVYDRKISVGGLARFKQFKFINESPLSAKERSVGIWLSRVTGYQFQKSIALENSGHIPDFYDSTKKIVVEFDGPTHFLVNTDGQLYSDAQTLLRDYIMKNKDGVKVVTIPYHIWDTIQNDLHAHSYLTCELEKVNS